MITVFTSHIFFGANFMHTYFLDTKEIFYIFSLCTLLLVITITLAKNRALYPRHRGTFTCLEMSST